MWWTFVQTGGKERWMGSVPHHSVPSFELLLHLPILFSTVKQFGSQVVEHARGVSPVGVAPFTIVDIFKTWIVCETRFHRQALIGVSKYTGLRCEQVAMRTALCVQSSGFGIPWEHTRLAASVWDHHHHHHHQRGRRGCVRYNASKLL